MEETINVPLYLSPEQYSEATARGMFGDKARLGTERIKEMCLDGQLPYVKTRGGQYKIKVYEDSVPLEKYKEVENENIRLKTIIQTVLSTVNQV